MTESMQYDGHNGNSILLWSGADSVEDALFGPNDKLRVWFTDQEITVPLNHWLHQCDDGSWEACSTQPVPRESGEVTA